MLSYQFKQNLSSIDSIVIDGRKEGYLLIYANQQIISLNIVKQQIAQNSLILECDNCKVYDSLSQCFSNKPCDPKTVFYCCEGCAKMGSSCSTFGTKNIFASSIIQDVAVFYNPNITVYQMEIIQITKNNCQMRMNSVFTDSKGQNFQTQNGESQKCTA